MRLHARVELGGFSLGCLVGNLTCMSIMEGSLSAADTLMPRAYGVQQYAEVGRLAIRAMCVGCLLLAMPILPLCLYSATLLQTYLGQNAEASRLAQDWICWYFVGAPANLAFRVCMRFLLAQQKPWPLVLSSIVPAVLIHPVLLHHLVARMGLVGSALAISITQWCMLLFLLLFFRMGPTKQVYHPETWPGLTREYLYESIRIRPTLRFLRLAIGGILSMNEWWFFEIMVRQGQQRDGSLVDHEAF
jgi:multidrug resistance protein, MATE family